MSRDLGAPSPDPNDPSCSDHPCSDHPCSGDPHDDHSHDDHPHDLGERLPNLGPVEALLRADVEALPVPSGSFERIRSRATRRRRVRAATGGGLVAAVVVGGLYLLGVPGPLWDAAPPVAATNGGSAAPTGSPGPTPRSGTPSPSAPSSLPSRPAPEPSVSAGQGPGSGGGGTAPTAEPTPTTTGGVGTASSPAAPATCATSQMTAALGGGDAGAGNLYRYLVLTNHGSTPCAVDGFPGLSLLTAQGTQLGASATFDHSFSYAPVVLQPGASASDTIHTLNSGATSCSGTSSSLRIYPPGDTASMVIPGQVMLCGGQLSVSPFTAGSTGTPPS